MGGAGTGTGLGEAAEWFEDLIVASMKTSVGTI
jgi:hypothetical protein